MEMRRQPEHTYSVGLTIFENLVPFDGEGDGVSSAKAEGRDAELEFAALQFIEERDEDARSARTDRMAESDGAAVDVDFFGIKLELPRNGDGRDGESFVEFD